jgi:hypothetical protein
MSLALSPSIVTNGLVLNIDTQNIKSYKGPAIQNLLTQLVPDGVSVSTGYSVSGGSEVVDVPQLGPTTVTTAIVQNNYTAFVPNSSNCCPRIMNYGSNITVSPSTLYTYGIVYKIDSGYTGPNFMYHYEYNGGTYVTELGVHTTANRIYLGNGWWWAWGTFTTQPTTTTIINAGAWYYQYSQYNDKFSVAKVLLTIGDKTQLHPKYWPVVNTSLTNTANVVDMTGTVPAISTSLTYSNAGVPSFVGGSSNNINLGNTAATQFPYNAPWSFQMAVNITDAGNGPGIMVKGAASASGVLLFYTTGSLYWKHNNSQVIGLTYTVGQTFIITVSYNGSLVSIYKNGVLTATSPAMVSTETASNLMLGQGDSPGTSTIYSFMKYNRALSATEVAQNFNALRGRFSL